MSIYLRFELTTNSVEITEAELLMVAGAGFGVAQ